MYYKFNNKENFKAWSLTIGIYLVIFIILLLAGASCSSPSRTSYQQRTNSPVHNSTVKVTEKFVLLSSKQVVSSYSLTTASTSTVNIVYRLKRLSNSTVVTTAIPTLEYYEIGDTIALKWRQE
jgi:hypothetical protein